MKKAMKWVGLVCLAAILGIGIYLTIPPKTLDFRGSVTQIENTEDGIVYHIEYVEHTQLVLVDKKTRIYRAENESINLSAQNVQVGDTIEGDFRIFTKNNRARFVRIW